MMGRWWRVRGSVAAGGLGLVALMVGCVGSIGGDGDGSTFPPPDEPDATGFSCDEAAGPTPTPMRRLSRDQYIETIRHLVGGDAIADEIADVLARVPPDALDAAQGRDYATQDQMVTQTHADVHWDVASAAALAMTATGPRLEALVGPCATDGDDANDASCVRDFVAHFGRRALRRPLSEDEVTFYAEDAYGDATDVAAASFADRLVVLLQAPQMTFRMEDGAPAKDDDDPDLFPLTAFEVAERLAYHFWQGPPDERLLAAAADGTLDREDGFRAELDRLVEDPRFDAALYRLVDGWLQLHDTPEFEGLEDNPQFMAFADPIAPTEDLGDAMREELERYFAHYARDGSFADFMTSRRSFATHETLAAIYDVPPWDGTGEPPTFADPRRVGPLSRAAFLASASARSHPILRGVGVLQRVMCAELPPPPENAGMDAPTDDDLVSTRTFTENLTQQPGACRGCHELINPPGFILDHFDALGRLRDEEKIYAADGTLLATFPLDTEASPRLHGRPQTMSDPSELSEAIVDAGDRAQACLARHYFRFAYGRAEDVDADGCQLRDLRDHLLEGSIDDMMKAIALRPEFRLRRRPSP
ncbi:MAG: DUF1592 domain-containing protein [Myxococcota bacterium]